jgi:hypothetical protein
VLQLLIMLEGIMFYFVPDDRMIANTKIVIDRESMKHAVDNIVLFHGGSSGLRVSFFYDFKYPACREMDMTSDFKQNKGRYLYIRKYVSRHIQVCLLCPMYLLKSHIKNRQAVLNTAYRTAYKITHLSVRKITEIYYDFEHLWCIFFSREYFSTNVSGN